MIKSMVFDKNNKNKRKGSTFLHSSVTILTPGCHFNGKLYCRGSSRIGGKVEGEIISEGLLIIEDEGNVSGQITAEETIVQGSVKGRLTSNQKVELTSTSFFEGDI